MPLVGDPDMTVLEESQYRLFQIKVFEKLFSQLHRYVELEPDYEKALEIMQLMKEYGRLINAKDEEFISDVDKNLQIKTIFDLMFEMF